jgi:hypothetical protein
MPLLFLNHMLLFKYSVSVFWLALHVLIIFLHPSKHFKYFIAQISWHWVSWSCWYLLLTVSRWQSVSQSLNFVSMFESHPHSQFSRRNCKLSVGTGVHTCCLPMFNITNISDIVALNSWKMGFSICSKLKWYIHRKFISVLNQIIYKHKMTSCHVC